MKIGIDQSGKIENTNRLTIIACSNKANKSLLITARDKRAIQSVFRKIGQPKIFVFKLFAVAIFALIKDDLKKIDQIIIDREYIGYENLIKQFIQEVAQKNNNEIAKEDIHFRSIGKKSRAHRVAIEAFLRKRGDVKLTAPYFYELAFAK